MNVGQFGMNRPTSLPFFDAQLLQACRDAFDLACAISL